MPDYQHNQYEQTGFWGTFTNDRAEDTKDYQFRHEHDYQTWEDNRMILRCNCGAWHYKD